MSRRRAHLPEITGILVNLNDDMGRFAADNAVPKADLADPRHGMTRTTCIGNTYFMHDPHNGDLGPRLTIMLHDSGVHALGREALGGCAITYNNSFVDKNPYSLGNVQPPTRTIKITEDLWEQPGDSSGLWLNKTTTAKTILRFHSGDVQDITEFPLDKPIPVTVDEAAAAAAAMVNHFKTECERLQGITA